MSNRLEENIIHDPEIKVLVVDDREDNLFSLETILDKDGYTIRKARSGREALKILLKDQDFTIILMDVQMPDLNGFETAEMISQSNRLKHIPILFITANDHGDENIFKGYQMGGVDYIYKPVNPDLLRMKVAVFVELHKKNMALVVQEKKLRIANKRLEREVEERKISEQKINVLNRQLTEKILQLKTTNGELERYAFIASHDLQEPLRKIIMFGNRLKDKYSSRLDADAIDHLERMVRASGRMQALIKNLLDFSRTTMEQEGYVETDLNEIVASVLSDLEMFIQQKNATINYNKLPKLKVIPVQFQQLFQNLLGNALKFSRPGVNPVISIEAEQLKGMYIDGMSYDQYEEDFYKIAVKDNGIGFEEKYASQIFSVFKRLHTFEQFEGTGIGLSICKKIVEKHQGYIYASSIPNEGATFTIILPLNFNEAISADLITSSP